MNQLDLDILRYEEKLLSAVQRNLPESIIQQYNTFLEKKIAEKRNREKHLH